MAQTKPSVPQLRFPEFQEEWKGKRVRQHLVSWKLGGNYANSRVPSSRPLIKMGNLGRGNMVVDRYDFIEPGEVVDPDDRIKLGDLFFNTRNTLELVGKVAIWRGELPIAYFNSNLLRIEFPCNQFMNYRLNSHEGMRALKRVAAGTTSVAAIYTGDFLDIETSVPALSEQRKIAHFLEGVDEKLTCLRRKRDLLTEYKRGVMRQIFSQELRFKRDDGGAFSEWREKRLGNVLTEHGLKSAGSEAVFSVSVHKGLVNQIEHLGRSFSAKETDHYNRVLPGDLVYTKSPTGEFPLGIVKQSKLETDVIVSPLYGVFTPETVWLGRILDAYFASKINVTNYLKPIVQKGAKNTINVTNAGFLSGTLRLPVDHDEQRKIAEFLSALDAKIDATAAKSAGTEAFKAGLLQQMFV